MNLRNFIIVLFFACWLVTSCSSGEKATSKKGEVEKMTDAVANRVVTGINSSLDAARKASEQINTDISQKEKMLHEIDN